jgi:hypothetical protein
MFAHAFAFLPVEWITGSVGNRFLERKGKPGAALRPIAERLRGSPGLAMNRRDVRSICSSKLGRNGLPRPGRPTRVVMARDQNPGSPPVCFSDVVARDPLFVVGRSATADVRLSDLDAVAICHRRRGADDGNTTCGLPGLHPTRVARAAPVRPTETAAICEQLRLAAAAGLCHALLHCCHHKLKNRGPDHTGDRRVQRTGGAPTDGRNE